MMAEAFDGNFIALVRAMDAATRAIDDMPDAKELTQAEIDDFDIVRVAASRLAKRAEALIEEFRDE